MSHRAWTLASRPVGLPSHSNFALIEQPETALADGQIRVANRWLSVDPYMRGRMNDVKSYVPGFQIGEVMTGGAVGEVIESRNPGFAVGDTVLHMAGWREEAVIGAEAMPNKIGAPGIPEQSWLHNMGLTGGTAWVGLFKVADAKPGDVVFVSAAAGAVGSAVVQICKAKGITVIGSAGGADKCAWLRELGADAAVDYKAGPLIPQLKAALESLGKSGIDVYFDNVGGDHLDAAFALANDFARFAICGMIDGYNSAEPAKFRYIMRVISARIRVEGFIYTDKFMPNMAEFYADMGGMIAAGQVTMRETVHSGIETMPDAFLGLFSGGNTGKMLVRV